MSEAGFGEFHHMDTNVRMRAFDRIVALLAVDLVQEPEIAKRMWRTLRQVFRAHAGGLAVEELAHETMLQFRADSAPMRVVWA